MNLKHYILLGITMLVGLVYGLGQPIITNQPQSLTNTVGSTAIFSVGATGTAPPFYQWQNYTPLPNETNATLVPTNLQSSSAGNDGWPDLFCSSQYTKPVRRSVPVPGTLAAACVRTR